MNQHETVQLSMDYGGRSMRIRHVDAAYWLTIARRIAKRGVVERIFAFGGGGCVWRWNVADCLDMETR